jgi:hypothetical protein
MKNIHVALIMLPALEHKKTFPGCIGVLPVFLSSEEAQAAFPDVHISECTTTRELED